MSFEIQFMNNKDEVNKIDKNPISIITLNGTLKAQTSLVNPAVLIESENVFIDANYAYIPIFKRYYYITDIMSIRNNLWQVSLHCDVLKTFSEGILGSNAIIARQENVYNLRLDDGSYKCYSDPLIVTKLFPKGFDTQSYIFAVLGNNNVISD